MDPLRGVAGVADLRRLAQGQLPLPLFDFIDGAAEDETTLDANRADFDAWRFRPRMLRDVSAVRLEAMLAGQRTALPLALAPIGLAGLAWPNGEILAARAAARAGIPFCLSTNSVARLEEIPRAAPEGENWFQLYFLKDRDWMNGLVDRARDAGYRALVVTVDLPLTGKRERDLRNAFTVPPRPTLSSALAFAQRLPWLWRSLRAPAGFGNFEGAGGGTGLISVAQHVATLFDPAAGWDDVEALREAWTGPLILKGILHPEDAERAVALGADAISVSNHGGRQLDGTVSAIRALPDIAAAVGGRCDILLDSGVRRGTDILKALALGASGVMIGRAYVWGLAAAGEPGVDKAIALLRAELETAMMLLGETELGDLGPDMLIPAAAP